MARRMTFRPLSIAWQETNTVPARYLQMDYKESHSAEVSAKQVVAPPRAVDALCGTFRSVYGVVEETPGEFRTLLARLDGPPPR